MPTLSTHNSPSWLVRLTAALLQYLPSRWRPLAIEFSRFVLVGGASFIIDAALVYAGIYLIGLSRTVAGLASFPLVVSFTWLGNRLFTFRAADRSKPHWQWLRLILVCAVGLVFNRGVYVLMVSTVPLAYRYPIIGLAAGTGCAMFFNFFLSRKLVFRSVAA